MSKPPPGRPATYQDLLALPEHVVGEIIDGELVVSPRPAARHAVASTVVGAELGQAFGRGDRGGPGGWVILFEPELHIVGQVLVPDMAGWRRERMPHVWLVDPAPQTLEVFRLDRDRKGDRGHDHEDEGWRLVLSVAGDVKARAEPFEAIALDLGPVWAR